MSERVLIISVAPLWSPHFETELELAATHRHQQDEVRIAVCQGFLKSCLANPDHRRTICMSCRSRFRSGLDAIGWTNEDWVPLDRNICGQQPEFSDFEDIDALREFEYKGVHVGKAAASSLVSRVRDSYPDMAIHSDLVRRLIGSAIQTYEATVTAIHNYQPDLVYILNGRFASTLPAVSACLEAGVAYKTHEAGYELGTYLLTKGSTVHDLEEAKRRIEEVWNDSSLDQSQKEAVGAEFFVSRRYGGPGGPVDRYRFTSSQARGHVSLTANEGNPITIFNSSEDEFSSLQQYKNPVYKDQMMALDAILGDRRLASVPFVLRAHPNLSGLQNTQMTHMRELDTRYPNLRVISPDDPTDTYELMERSRAVLTFGSTTGVEAVFWKTPSILVGRAMYEDLACLRPKSHEELVSLLLNPPEPSEVMGALKYGYYMRRGAHSFSMFEQTAYDRGSFDGKDVRPAWPYILLRKSRNLWYELKNQPGRRIRILTNVVARRLDAGEDEQS